MTARSKHADNDMNREDAAEPAETDAEAAEEAAEVLETYEESEDAGESPPSAELAALEEAQAEVAALRDQLLRARAEFDNYRKRMAREAERTRKLAAEALVRDLLPVADHLELALQHADGGASSLAEGVHMVLRQMQDVMARHGVAAIPAEGERFDPTVHEAVMQQSSDTVAEGHVVTEFQRGYRLGDQIIRPAKVVVSTGPEAATEPGDAAAESPANGVDTP